MKLFNNVNTRQRAMISSIIAGFVMFIVSSPLGILSYEFLNKPVPVKNISVLEKPNEIDISWAKNDEKDIAGYELYIDGKLIDDPDNKFLNSPEFVSYEFYNPEATRDYKFQVKSKDTSGKFSEPINFTARVSDSIKRTSYNSVPDYDPLTDLTLITTVLSVILWLLTTWVLFFNVTKRTLVTIATFPGIASVPYSILTLSILVTINSVTNKIFYSGVISIGYMVFTYLLILTANILNGSMYAQLPLEQAAKASQFIFGLVSTYLMVIFVFSSNFNIILRILIISFFVFYFTYSGLSVIRGVSLYQVFLRAVATTLLIATAIFIISIWPIDYVYAILFISVLYYIVLNVSLEIRNRVGKALWIEYTVLFFLIIFLILINATWGIKGTII